MPMMHYDALVKEPAALRHWALQVPQSQGVLPAGDYFFREMYCNDLACDCRRVMLVVHRGPGDGEPLAYINYGWESEEFYRKQFLGNRQFARDVVRGSLDPLQPQSRVASVLLREFQRRLREDPDYPDSLRERYLHFKEVLKATLESPVPEAPPAPARTWTLTEIIGQLSSIPRDAEFEPYESALRAASDPAHRPELTRELIAETHRVADEPHEHLKRGGSTLAKFGLYLLAEFREQRAWPALRRVFSLPDDQTISLFEEAITDDGPAILASLADGDAELLKGLILDPAVDEYVRSAAVNALVVQTAWGERARERVITDLEQLFEELPRTEEHPVWGSIATAIVILDARELLPLLKSAYADGVVNRHEVPLEWVTDAFVLQPGAEETRAVGEAAEFAALHRPIVAAAATALWSCFMDNDDGRCPDCGGWHDRDEEGHDVWEPGPGLLRSSPPPPPPNYLKPEPYVAPPKVGRNEPCPCGSGIKYKKCCGGAG